MYVPRLKMNLSEIESSHFSKNSIHDCMYLITRSQHTPHPPHPPHPPRWVSKLRIPAERRCNSQGAVPTSHQSVSTPEDGRVGTEVGSIKERMVAPERTWCMGCGSIVGLLPPVPDVHGHLQDDQRFRVQCGRTEAGDDPGFARRRDGSIDSRSCPAVHARQGGSRGRKCQR